MIEGFFVRLFLAFKAVPVVLCRRYRNIRAELTMDRQFHILLKRIMLSEIKLLNKLLCFQISLSLLHNGCKGCTQGCTPLDKLGALFLVYHNMYAGNQLEAYARG